MENKNDPVGKECTYKGDIWKVIHITRNQLGCYVGLKRRRDGHKEVAQVFLVKMLD